MSPSEDDPSAAEFDRRYPHQIILPSACYSGTNFRWAHAFCIGLSLAPRGHVVFENDDWHYVFCFAKREDAQALKERFGGRWFNASARDGGGEVKVSSKKNR